MQPWMLDTLRLAAAGLLVLINGFFVAAEFALVKIRPSRVDTLVKEQKPFAKTFQWLVQRLDASLSACQLGITMASLALGWIGEPAIAHLFKPVFPLVGIDSPGLVHGISFIIAFSLITSAHLVIGEQAPKIFAIRRPELLGLWCAVPLKIFFHAAYPFLAALNWASALLLRLLGVRSKTDESHHTEEELRLLLEQARMHGELSRSEHELLNAVFEFDDLLAKQIMVPRGEIIALDLGRPLGENLELVKRTHHTRYPLCRGSLDDIVGVVHIKDLFGLDANSSEKLFSLKRPPQRVPRSMTISRILGLFKATRQHMAFVINEHDTIVGMVTLENVLEQIVGSVQDEFDDEPEDIVPHGRRTYLVLGATPIGRVEKRLKVDFGDHEADTMSGLLVERLGRFPAEGDVVQWRHVKAKVLEVRASRAERLQIELSEGAPEIEKAEVD